VKVFVTGATGFVAGTVTLQLLARGDEVRALVRDASRAQTLARAGVDLFTGDLSDGAALHRGMAGVDAVVHGAAMYEVGIPPSRRPAMFAANVTGTERVLEAALDAGVRRVAYISTVAVFGNTQGQVVDESYTRTFKKSTLKDLTFVAWQLPMLERNSAFVRNANGTVNVEESRRGGRDLALYGGQLRTRFEPSSKVALNLSISDLYFFGTQLISPVQVFGSLLQLPVIISLPGGGTVTSQALIPRDLLVGGNGNLGLTIASNNATNRDGRLSSGFNLVDMIARLELRHSNRFPVTLIANFVTNTQTHDVVTAVGTTQIVLPNHENNGLWVEAQVGQTREKGNMQFGYTFMRIEKDAVLTPFNFSDVTQQSDMRGHRFLFAYAADPRVVFTVTGIITERLRGLLGPFVPTPPGSLNRPTKRLQLDTTIRF